jgi:hypothetical protein
MWLPGMGEALGSIVSTLKKEKKKVEEERCKF